MLHDRPGNAHGVTFLEGIQTDRRCWHLPSHDDHRDTVHVRRCDTGDRVGYAWTAGNQGDADLSRCARETIRRVDCGLFVAHQNVLNRILFVKRVVDVQNSTAGITPNLLDTFGL